MTMLKLKVSPSESVLLLVLVAILLGVGWYYFLFSPLYDTVLDLNDQLAQATQQLAERQTWQLHDAQTTIRLQELMAEQAALQAKFDPISHGKDVIDYFAKLGVRVSSLAVKSDQVAVTVAVPNYSRARLLLSNLEQHPNFVPVSLALSPGETESGGGYGLKLQVNITWGQAAAGAAEMYARTTPFGR